MPTWGELEKEFTEIGDSFRDTRLDFQWGDSGDHWRLAGSSDIYSKLRFEALARIGGEKLLEENISEKHPDLIEENDSIIRWYKAVKNICEIFRFGFISDMIENDIVVGHIFTGSIDRIAEASTLLCLKMKVNSHERKGSMRSLMRDTVTIVKQDGRRFSDIPANVQKNKIYINDGELPIEEGDKIIRKLPNDLTETYIVVDRGYTEGIGGIKAHYQIEVKKESSIPYQTAQGQIIYNLIGSNSRVNIHSQDSSENVVYTTADKIFNDLRDAINNNVKDDKEKESILKKVDGLANSQGKPTFIERYKEFIELAANHMAILGPFIPALTQMFP